MTSTTADIAAVKVELSKQKTLGNFKGESFEDIIGATDDALFEAADKDNSGGIDKQEFLKLAAIIKRKAEVAIVKEKASGMLIKSLKYLVGIMSVFLILSVMANVTTVFLIVDGQVAMYPLLSRTPRGPPCGPPPNPIALMNSPSRPTSNAGARSSLNSVPPRLRSRRTPTRTLATWRSTAPLASLHGLASPRRTSRWVSRPFWTRMSWPRSSSSL